jgi:hypothetical protein
MQKLIAKASNEFTISKEVFDWMLAITNILKNASKEIRQDTLTRQTRKALLTLLEKAAADYREKVYRMNGFSGKTQVETVEIKRFLDVALKVLDSSCRNNLREDGLYNAYNILSSSAESLTFEELYPMLEGQVAVLSSGLLKPKEAVGLLDKLFASDMYRADQDSFMLYPDRDLIGFVQKNKLPREGVQQSALLTEMISANDKRIIVQDEQGGYHFNASFENNSYLQKAIAKVKADYTSANQYDWLFVEELYEQVFDHKSFTGRSGTMFAYEGLGSIYWHMVSKLLLAVQENYQQALSENPNSNEVKLLADYYYKVRAGIGFNKTPENYGAFPTDPYSHTPKHAGAQQPGMTGQVKEEVITRFGELGLEVVSGGIVINPSLLHRTEFLTESVNFECQNVQGETQSYVIKESQLAFTYCQTPFIYQMNEQDGQGIVVHFTDGTVESFNDLHLPASLSEKLFQRTGEIKKIIVTIPVNILR